MKSSNDVLYDVMTTRTGIVLEDSAA